MRSAYFRELEKVSIEDIRVRLSATYDEVKGIIESLKYNNRKVVRPYIEESENIEGEEVFENTKGYYSFNFVGTAIYKDFIIKCYPKYLTKEYTNSEKDEILKTVIQVLKKYNKSEKNIIGMSTEENDSEFNYLSIIDFILSDYIENGLYSTQKEIYEFNGEGEIDWDKTVNDTTAFLVNNRPIYFDLITKNGMSNEGDFFRQMHMYVITECSRMLKESGLSHILSLPIIEFDTNDNLFNDNEFVLNQIYKELNVQFASRKQEVLKSLYSYFSKKHGKGSRSNLSLYGTMNFNLVWEKTCSVVLNSQLNNRLGEIEGIDIRNLEVGSKKKKLKQLIPYPYWIPKNATTTKDYKKAKKTLQLDIVSIFNKDNKRYFVIWDAKYYNLVFEKEKGLKNNPGIEDVVKQYVYNLVYADLIKKQKFDYSYNILLFPSESLYIEVNGKVDLEFLRLALNVNDILIMSIPAKIIFSLYLEDKVLDFKDIDFKMG